MAIEVPENNVFVPEVPAKLASANKELYNFLQSLKRSVEQMSVGFFENGRVVAEAINTGTTGTFVCSGKSITVANGIVVSVT